MTRNRDDAPELVTILQDSFDAAQNGDNECPRNGDYEMSTSFDLVSADDFAESDVTPRKASGRKAAPSPLVSAIQRSLDKGKGMQTPRSMALKGKNGSGSPYNATRRELERAASQVGEDVRVTFRRVVDVERDGFAYLWFRAFRVDKNGKEIGNDEVDS